MRRHRHDHEPQDERDRDRTDRAVVAGVGEGGAAAGDHEGEGSEALGQAPPPQWQRVVRPAEAGYAPRRSAPRAGLLVDVAEVVPSEARAHLEQIAGAA